MTKSAAIIGLLRLPFLTVTLGGVFVGTSFAVWEAGRFNLGYFLLALFGACCFHIATNVANDYFDFKSGADAANISGMTPFSGGSRMVLEGHVKPGEALAISLMFALVGSVVGIGLNSVLPGNVLLWIGLAGLFFIYSYNGFPVRLVNKGLGEVAIFLSWGPLMVGGAYYVQAGELPSGWVLLASAPSGILTTLVLLINEFADKEGDAAAGRKTWVILFGNRAGLNIYLSMAFACYILVLMGVLFGGWPVVSLAVVITLHLALQAYRTGREHIGDWPKFLGAVKATILLNMLFLVILGISFLAYHD